MAYSYYLLNFEIPPVELTEKQKQDPYFQKSHPRKRDVKNPEKFYELIMKWYRIDMTYLGKKGCEEIKKSITEKKKIVDKLYTQFPDQPESIVDKLLWYLEAQRAYYSLNQVEKARKVQEEGKQFAQSVPEKFMKYGIIRRNVENYEDYALDHDTLNSEPVPANLCSNKT